MRKCVCVASRIAFACAVYGASLAPLAAADLGGYSDYRGGMRGDGIVVPALYFAWTGLYVGGNLGYGWGSTSSSSAAVLGSHAFDINPNGFLGGGQVGYNWQNDAFLFGLEGDVGYLGADDSDRTSTAFANAEYSGYGALTARIGYANARWLFYAKGGLAFANILNEAGAIVGGVEDPYEKTSKEEIHTGWALGAGTEYAFQRNWSMKFEYMYMDFGEQHTTNADGDSFTHENDIHTLKVGFNYRPSMGYEPLK